MKRLILYWIVAILFVVSWIWYLWIYFSNWDVLYTHKEWLFIEKNPIILLGISAIGYIVLKITQPFKRSR